MLEGGVASQNISCHTKAYSLREHLSLIFTKTNIDDAVLGFYFVYSLNFFTPLITKKNYTTPAQHVLRSSCPHLKNIVTSKVLYNDFA